MKKKKVLVIGASGFIGSHIVGHLILHGYNVRCAVRDVDAFKLRFNGIETVKLDLNDKITKKSWKKYLDSIDIIINAAGLLNSSHHNDIEKVHIHGPKSLINAAVEFNIKRIIHISALGIDEEHDTSYSNTKKMFDNYCKQQTEIDWVILKPSLVYTNNCYGGTSLLRGLASLPYFIPLIGNGDQKFQPIHMEDLMKVIECCVKYKGSIQSEFPVVGPDVLEVKDILSMFRRWMGISEGTYIKIPHSVIKLAAKLGDCLGGGPLNSTSYKMLQNPNVGDYNKVVKFFGIKPRPFITGLNSTPLTIQSLWHARFYLFQPIANWVLAAFWIFTGIVTICNEPKELINQLAQIGIPTSITSIFVKAFSIIDIIIGLAALTKKYLNTSYKAQLILVISYTVFLTIFTPSAWLDPLGSVSKNIPIILLIITLMLLKKGR